MASPTLSSCLEMFDLFHKDRPKLSNNPPEIEPYTYDIPCFCGETLMLIPQDGESVSCVCGATASFDGNISLEPA